MTKVKLTRREKAGYSLGDAACHIVFDNVMFYMMFFYTDIFGISAAYVGTLFLITRIMDAITDPLMGIIVDRTNTRWGKFRPYILWGALPFGLICTLTYSTPDIGMTGKMVYAAVTYVALTLIFTAVNVPYCGLGDVITPDPKQRMSLQTWRFVLSGISGMVSTVLLMPLAKLLGGENEAFGYGAGMGVLSLAAIILLLLCFYSTKERLHAKEQFSSNIWKDVKDLLRNGPWRMVGILSILNIMQWSVRGGAMVYYVKYFVGNENLFSVFLATYSTGSILGVASAKPLTNRICKVRLFGWINGVLALVSLSLFFVPPNAVIVMFVYSFVIGFFHQMMTPIQWVMISDSVDFGEWRDRRRLTGISFAFMLFVMKAGLALGGALIGWTLSGVGYSAGGEQDSLALGGIVFLFAMAPAILYAASFILIRWYPLKGDYFDKIVGELDARHAKQHAVES